MGIDVQVTVIKRRTPLPKRALPEKNPPLQLSDVIERVARIEEMAIRLQGVGHTNRADAFAEGKDEIRAAARRLKDDLRRRGVERNR